jgi:anti-sigma B factor antagonist
MPLEVRQREVESILILDLHGRLVLGPDVTDLRRAIVALSSQGKNNVIVNLKEVDYIDSTGLGTLVIAHSTFEKAGGAMKLLHVSKRSAEMLILT